MLGCAAVMGVMAVLPSTAAADSASIAFLDAAGNPDPVAGVGRTMVATGTSDSSKYVYVKARPAGGAPCAPTPRSDSGDYQGFGSRRVNGSFRVTYTGTWRTAGSFQYCTWLQSSSDAPSTPFTQIINFRNPRAAITGSVLPVSPIAGRRGTLLISGASEAPGDLYARFRPAGGAPCAPSPKADSGTWLVGGMSVDGVFRRNADVTARRPGPYLACMWGTRDGSSEAPVAMQSVTFTVRAPCRVPRVGRRMRLRDAKRALGRAKCAVGRVKYRYSRTRRRGRVVKFGSAAGTRFDPGTRVSVVVSKGKRHRRR